LRRQDPSGWLFEGSPRPLKHEAARRLRDWLISESGQSAIGAYTVNGEQLFHPSAAAPK
jgi:ABC-type tungstate transport system permease subunit